MECLLTPRSGIGLPAEHVLNRKELGTAFLLGPRLGEYYRASLLCRSLDPCHDPPEAEGGDRLLDGDRLVCASEWPVVPA
jgi:hypothetical protein